MALVVADFVKETSATTGTGTYTLAGAVTGFQSFAIIGNGNTTYYSATDGTSWEVGIGTYTSAGTTLARTTILGSSNANAAVNWASTVTLDCAGPSSKFEFLFATTTGISAAGTTQGGATALTFTSDFQTFEFTTVVTASANGGILPQNTAAMRANIVNRGAGTLKIYPASGGTIDGLAANAAISIPPKSSITITSKDASNNWYSVSRTLVPLAPVAKTSGTTFTSDANSAYLKVTVVGGGGGGSNTSTAGGGGGSGGIAIKLYSSLPSTAYTYAVGAAGAAQSNGGNSTFTDGTTLITGGLGTGTSTNGGGAGGSATNGDINLAGASGGKGQGVVSGASMAGAGGSNMFGFGGAATFHQTNNNTAGQAGSGFGGGGGGAMGGGTAGAGTAGVVIIEEWIWQ